MQTSFLENLVGVKETEETLGDVVFPKGFEVRDFQKLRKDFEALANKYGLSLPAKLRKGQLVLEWKPFPEEIKLAQENSNQFSLTEDELAALRVALD